MRAGLALATPLLFFGLIELGLRIAGRHYPTGFLLADELHGEAVWRVNDRFGERFFGPVARRPVSAVIPRGKPAGTLRVVVLGGSAAMGDPAPEFGLPRMLAATLRTRWPGQRFEVVNAAMTGINSHVVRDIAADCARIDADVWVVYMGNNEVIGPFGAGTVFGDQTPPLWKVRSILGLRRSAIGQWLLTRRTSGSDEIWTGLQAFEQNHVAANDPRLARTYEHFERNLNAILDAAAANGVEVVLSPVVVNLRDCGPFASAPGRPLGRSEREAWQMAFDDGVTRGSVRSFQRAAEIDPDVADLQYLLGRALAATGRDEEAEVCFASALQLDRLRFRCDSRLNLITVDAAQEREGVRLATEGEVELIPGNEHFLEHVHLTFAGNHVLARIIAEQVEKALGDHLAGTATDWPTAEDCAARLAWDPVAEYEVLTELMARLQDPPFTGQIDHERQVETVKEAMASLGDVHSPATLSNALANCGTALALDPDDATILVRQAMLRTSLGQHQEALVSLDRALMLATPRLDLHMNRARVLGRLGRSEDALVAWHAAQRLDPDDPWVLDGLAGALEAASRDEEALQYLRACVEARPRYGPAHLRMARILEKQGKTEEAARATELAVRYPTNTKGEMAEMARELHRRERFADAAVLYEQTLRFDPADPRIHLGLAQCLSSSGRAEEAQTHFQIFARLAPDLPEASFLNGMQCVRRRDYAGALALFERAIASKPDFLQAHINRAVTLKNLGRTAEAADGFRAVLRLDPGNPIATRNLSP